MRTSPLRRALKLSLLWAMASSGQAAGQAPLFLVDSDTRIGSFEYVFPEGRTFAMALIEKETALHEPSGWVRRALGRLPFIPSPAPVSFNPVVLQKDVVRLKRFYARMGYLRADISYDVQLDTIANAVDVTLRVTEGPPLVLDTLVYSHPDSADLSSSLPEDLGVGWELLTAEAVAGATGRRVGQPERQRLRSEALRWVRDWGYPFARVDETLEVDSLASTAALRIQVAPGPRARVGAIVFEGNRALSTPTLRRELPFREGDWYSSSAVAEGQRQIFGLDLVRLTLADLPPDQPEDSTVVIRYRVDEGRPRLLSGEAGYSSVSGIRAQTTWAHRDFTGGARTLSTSLDARSGWLAAEGSTDRRVGASATLRQPYVFDRRISGSLSPFIEYRDGIVDRSWSYGIVAAVLWEKGPLANVSLEYRLSRREVLDVRAGLDVLDGIDFIDALAALDSLESGAGSALVGLSTLHGEVDNPVDPSEGWVLRTSTQLAGPAALSATEYVRGQVDATGFLPLGRYASLTLRGGAGLLHPFGKSVPTPQSDTLAQLARLRDAMLTAGGTQSVRGWGSGLLGPKVPNFRLVPVGDSVVVEANRYVPFAGFARVSTSAEIRFPLPFSESDNGTFVFLDGAKVWNPNRRFGGGTPDAFGQDAFFWGTGAGVSLETLAGAVRISVGYKLNPSLFDLRDASAVADALAAGLDFRDVAEDNIRRFHLHLAIGRRF